MKQIPTRWLGVLVLLATFTSQPLTAFAQGTAFTYQGRLNDGTNPAVGVYDLRFDLFAVASGGFPATITLTNPAVLISNGLFTVTLDFPPGLFDGNARWLEVAVRTNGGGAFAILAPRQKFTATPYAITAGNLTGTASGNGAGLTNINAATLGGLSASNFWNTTGNAGTAVGVNFIGTTDAQPLLFKVNNVSALSLFPNSTSPNFVAGYGFNGFGVGKAGTTISGGGQSGGPNLAFGNFATVAGGANNQAGGERSTVSGGENNIAAGDWATVGGGFANYALAVSTVSGGSNNFANSKFSVIAGGIQNATSGDIAAVGGGQNNQVTGFGGTIGGGLNNVASGSYATVPGGANNTAGGYASLAAGYRAKASHDASFVWADSTFADFTSTAADQFLIRASGGVGIGMNNPQKALDVADGTGPSGHGGNVHVGAYSTGPDPKLIHFGDLQSGGSAFVSIGEAGADDRMQLTGGTFVFTNLPGSSGSGWVGVGRTPAANPLEVEGNASKTAAGSWLANSDARIKTDVQTVTHALEKLEQVRPVEFHYTKEYRAKHPSIEDRPYLNVVAQEFQKVFPDAVKSSGEKLPNGDDILQVDTYPLTIYSAAAIQELNRKLNDDLKQKQTEITELKQELGELKQLVGSLAEKLKGDAK